MNNRQANNGRRRGRGGQQRPGGGNSGQQGNGNRIDNRARGNAAQLLEKYKSLAADAQRQGDRVNAEYYLQFADHYFRVLSETRARFEEQNPNARRPQEANDDQDEDFDYDADGNRGGGDEQQQQAEPRQQREYREPREARDRDDRGGNREDREPRRNVRANGGGYANGHAQEGEPGTQESHGEGRQERAARQDRPVRQPRAEAQDRPERQPRAEAQDRSERQPRAEAQDRPERQPRAEAQERPRRAARPRREEPVAEGDHGIDVAVLPPAFGADLSADTAVAEPEKKPRRRRVRADDGEATSA